MNVKIGITWIPRQIETLPQTLGSIGQPVTVYPDGFKLPYKVPTKSLGDNVGCFKHYYRVLKDLCDSDADYVSIMSDDILFRENWLETALKGFDANTGFVACYVPRGLAKRYKWTKGFYEVKGGWDKTWGGGYIYKRKVALEILKHPFLIDHRDNYAKNQQIDHAIPETVHRMGLKQIFCVPSLINHIGFTSTIGHIHRREDRGAGW